jgi:hypothetical protein
MNDTFDIHKWNKDRYLSESEAEEQNPYDTAMKNLATKADITLHTPSGGNKFRKHQYEVGYTYRNGEEYEDGIEYVEASSEEEAISKAKELAPRLARLGGKFYPKRLSENKLHNMNLEELKQQIREEVLSTLQEKKKKEDKDSKETSEEMPDMEGEVSTDDNEKPAPTSSNFGVDPKLTKLQNALKAAYDVAKEIGDEKLSTQIGNTITYFTRTHVVTDEKSASLAEIRSHIRNIIKKHK